FYGRSIRGSGIKDISWFGPSGEEMSDEDWGAGFVHCLGMRLAGDQISDLNEKGDPIVGDTILLLLNAHHKPIPFKLPTTKVEHKWQTLCDTANRKAVPPIFRGGQQYALEGRSMAVLRAATIEPVEKAAAAQQAPAPAPNVTVRSAVPVL